MAGERRARKSGARKAEHLGVALGGEGEVQQAEQDQYPDRGQPEAGPQGEADAEQEGTLEAGEAAEVGRLPFGDDRERRPRPRMRQVTRINSGP